MYGVSAEDDHIAPWRQTFRINAYVTSPKRFVLSSSGHILAILNPPVDPPNRSFRVGAAHRGQTADAWRAKAETNEGSWWQDWSAWLAEKCGPLGPPPPLASEAFPRLADAPGSYVLERQRKLAPTLPAQRNPVRLRQRLGPTTYPDCHPHP